MRTFNYYIYVEMYNFYVKEGWKRFDLTRVPWVWLQYSQQHMNIQQKDKKDQTNMKGQRERTPCQGLASGCHCCTNINFVHKDCGKRRKERLSHELNEIQELISSRAYGRLEQR